MFKTVAGFLMMAVLSAWSQASLAQAFPTRPIRIIIPAPPGGGQDVLARLLSTSLAQELGQQPVTTENRGAANGLVGAEAVAKSAPDGYTLLLGSNATYAINVVTFATLPYDPLKSFTPVSQVSSQPFLLTVNPSLPVNSIAELVSLAKARPGKLNYATTGAVTVLSMSFLATSLGISMQDVPYQGLGPAIPDAIGGRVELLMGSMASMLPQVRSGKLRAIGITTDKRSALAPDLPTIAEQGFPGYTVSVWTALAGPAGVPGNIVDRLNAATVKVLSSPDMMAALVKQGIEASPSTPAQLGDRIRQEIVRWQKVAVEAGIKPQ